MHALGSAVPPVCRICERLPLPAATQDQFTAESALRQAVLEGGGALLRQDDSYQPEGDAAAAAAGTAAAAAAAARSGSSGGGAAVEALPGAPRRDLLLRVFPGADHFWFAAGHTPATYAVGWLETLLRSA